LRVALVNTNRIRPPIAPIGLEYVAEAVAASGHEVAILDLCWAPDPRAAIEDFFRRTSYGLVGITLRNTDDCVAASRESFLAPFADAVGDIRRQTDAPVVVGGVGFSTMPETALSICGADAGVRGEGEFVFPDLAGRIEAGRPWRETPGLVKRRNGKRAAGPPAEGDLSRLPGMRRTRVDNARYFREGGQAGFESKRGCAGACVYCADPVAKGARVRARPPRAVADEIEALLAQGIDHLHTCDSEFNMPEAHALAVCEEMARRGLGERARWYAYCAPAPFPRELARAMRRSGCAGVNFGADSGDPGMLERLGRPYGPEAISDAVSHCRAEGIATMVDLLLGSPGETPASVRATIELMRRAEPDRVGVALGVRIYPGTALARRLEAAPSREGLSGGGDPSDPTFYLEPALSDTIHEILDGMIGGDRRFFFYDPTRPDRDYNYNANDALGEAIRKGYRGAYWDILRRVADGVPPSDGGERP
jgi:radical SAM superfamily enzyme YgiQ (UPF0313 family)